MAKNLISRKDIVAELGIERFVTGHDERVREVNGALCDVYTSGILRDAVKQLGRPIPLFRFGRWISSEKSKMLELRPEGYMVVHSGIGDINHFGITPVSLENGILSYGGSPLAEEICRHGGFGIYNTAKQIRQRIADTLFVNSCTLESTIDAVRRNLAEI